VDLSQRRPPAAWPGCASGPDWPGDASGRLARRCPNIGSVWKVPPRPIGQRYHSAAWPGWADTARPQRKWGPALLPAPTAPSEGSAGVRNLVDRAFRPTYPLSILAHQLRRRFRSDRSLLRGARPTYLTTWPEGSLVFRSVRPAHETLVRRPQIPAKPSDFLRPFLGNPLSRPALLTKVPKNLGSRVARQKDFSSGASSRLAPTRTRKLFPLPAGGDRTFGHLPHLPAVAGSLMRPGPPSRSPMHHAPLIRVAEAKNVCSGLWITGILVTTVGTLSQIAIRGPIEPPAATLDNVRKLEHR
jgi:hypothetical protein